MRSVLNSVNKLKSFEGSFDEDDGGNGEVTTDTQEEDRQEFQLILRAFLDVNMPKFVSDDLPLVNGIIKDMFPSLKYVLPHLNRDKIESNLSAPGIQGHQENAFIKSFEMSLHLICL